MIDTLTVLRAAVRFRTILFLCLAAAARANILPVPVTLAECVDGFVTDDPASCSVSGNHASASGSLTLSPFVGLTAQSNSGPINPDGNPVSGAFVSVEYSFQVLGGNPGDLVPIRITTNLTSSGSSVSHAFGFAEVVLHTGFGDKSVAVCSNGTCGRSGTSFSGTFGWFVNSGESGDTVHLEVEAQSGDSVVSESANAAADPFLFIDPTFAGAANYSIELSPGVGNGLPAAVPEPGTFWLLGTALVILAVRRVSLFQIEGSAPALDTLARKMEVEP